MWTDWWARAKTQLATPEGVQEYFAPLFNFVEGALASGQNVLVHCLAGAHRAGTCGTALCMHTTGLPLNKALAECQSRRNCINPIAGLMDLLQRLEASEAALCRK